MLRRSLSLAFVLALAVPATSMAKDPAPTPACSTGIERCATPVDPGTGAGAPTGRYFYVAAIERGSDATKVEGKLWIEGGKLGASVGCNSIGAQATFDGRTLTLRDLVTTEMACEERLALAERALVAALSAGPFTWDGSAFTGKGVRIVASDTASAPAQPPDGAVSDPNAPAGKPVGPGVVEPEPGLDLEACRKFIPEKEWAAVFGPATGGSGSGNASSGSGGGTSGSSGRGVAPAPAPEASAITTDPAPGGPRVPSRPNSEPQQDPDATSGAEPSTTKDQPVAMPMPAIDLPAVDGPAVDAPAVGSDGSPRRLPAATADRPVPTPSTTACRDLLSRIRTMAAPAAASGGNGKASAEAARDMALDQAASVVVDPAIVMVLVLAGGVLVVLWLRAIPGRSPVS